MSINYPNKYPYGYNTSVNQNEAKSANSTSEVGNTQSNSVFDINEIRECLKNQDKSILNKLNSIPVSYNYSQRADGFDFECTYNGQHYSIHYTNPNYDTTKVGTGSWNTQTIEEAGIDLNKYKKYFIGVYSNYYRFNADAIKEDFKGKNIQNPSDLKAAIDEMESQQNENVKAEEESEETSVGNGSWDINRIQDAGIDINKYKKYFIGVYTNIYRFNTDAIKEDFKGKNIQNPEDLKTAIDEMETTDDNAVVSTKTQNFSDGSYSVYEMDSKGRDIRITDYNPDGSIRETLEFEYNDDGTVIQTSKNAAGNVTQISNVDANGNVTHNSWFDDNGSLRETADYERDENGIETTITRDANGTMRHKDAYDYTNNRHIKSVTYDEDGNLAQYDIYEYDAWGCLTATTYDSDNKIIVKSMYSPDGELSLISEYNENEQITSEKQFKEGKISIDSENSYDEKGSVTGRVMTWYNDDGTVSTKRFYEFNNNGQIIDGNLFGVSAIHQYWYDSDGNIIREEHNEIKEEHDEVKTDLQKFEERVNSDEFNREMSQDELQQIVEEYAELVINDLTSKYEYPQRYVDNLSTFITNSVFYDACDKVSNYYSFETINGKEVLKVLDKYIHELTDTPLTECNSNNIREEQNALGMHHPFYENIAEKFINENLLGDIHFWEYEYNNDNKAMSTAEFYDCLTKYIAKNYGMEDELKNNGYINFANLIKLDTNGDGNWLDDFYRITAEFAHKNDNMDFDNVNELNINSIFKNNDIISFTDFYEQIKEAFLSDDPSLNKLQKVLAKSVNKYDINNNYDKEDLIKSIIILMNKAAGAKNSYPVTISRDTMEQLNGIGIFDELDNIINSDELRDLYYFGVDGYVDDFGQGNTGDCWLLAAISALDATESGRQVIKDSIAQDETGNTVVTFRGIGISYTITPEEMVEARDANAYSYGDNDVQTIELATEKLRRDITTEKIYLRYGNYGGGESDNGSYGGGIEGGWQNYMLYYLTGNIPQVKFSYPDSESDVIEFLSSIYNDFQTGNFAGYFSLGDKNVQATTTDNKIFSWNVGAYHAFSILSMSEDTITIANPWYPDKPYKFSWEEFANLLPYDGGLVSTKVHEHEYKTTYNNTIDFDSTFRINGKEYSLNDILSSEEPIFYETNDINNIKNYYDIENIISNIALSALSDIKPEIVDNLVESLSSYYGDLLDKLDNNGTQWYSFMGGFVPVNSSIANENGVYQTENGGGVIDIRSIVQKMLDTLKLLTREPLTLEEYEDKLQGEGFEKDVNIEELNSYLNEYRELLINNLKSNNNYNEKYIRLFDDFIKEKISNIGYNSNTDEKLNLKEKLNSIKDTFNELQNSSSQECKIDIYGDLSDNNNLSRFISNIISNAYYDNRNYIDAYDVYHFREQLTKYIAEKYEKTEELEQRGTIDLSQIIQDSNGDGSWVDDFFSIVNEFSHKDDNKIYNNTIDYDAEIELNGEKYTLTDILSSDEQVMLNINDEQYTFNDIYQLLQQLVYAMHDVKPEYRNRVLSTIREYYYTFANLCFNPDAYNNGIDTTIYNYLHRESEKVHFDSSVAKDYGIIKTDEGVQINIKTLLNKLLDYFENRY